MSTQRVPHIRVVAKAPITPVPTFIAIARAIEAAVSASVKTFPSPVPTMALLASHIRDLVTAQSVVPTRRQGAAAHRDAKLQLVDLDLKQLRSYVETVANADPSHAVAIVASAGMTVRKARAAGAKNDVTVKAIPGVSGSVVVTARVGTRRKQSYEWEVSLDGGTSWLALPATVVAKTTITGLTRGTTVLVRRRTISKAGISPWSDPASCLVR